MGLVSQAGMTGGNENFNIFKSVLTSFKPEVVKLYKILITNFMVEIK